MMMAGLSRSDAAPQLLTATITLAPETATGDPLLPHRLTFIEIRSRVDFGPRFAGLSAHGIPFGTYDLLIWIPGYKNYERRVYVFEKEITIRASLTVGMPSGRERITGVVRSLPRSDKGAWLLLFPLAGSPGNSRDVRLEDGGKFSVDLESGLYLFVVVQGTEVLATRSMYAGHDMPPILIQIKGPESEPE